MQLAAWNRAAIDAYGGWARST
eukprot:SAG31_NODE_32751_length_352_cov_0.608696_1_plen_21_part_10